MDIITPRLHSWAPDLEGLALQQAHRTASLPIVVDHISLMPDAHLGLGATVGSVIPTEGAIIPSAVGVDVGCGMAAIRTDLRAEDLPDSLDGLMSHIAKAVPAGVGRGHDGGRKFKASTSSSRNADRAVDRWLADHEPPETVKGDLLGKAKSQFGSLGSGNHFFEVCLDELDRVWLFLHSGSRGVGNVLAQRHINRARRIAKHLPEAVRDPDLAWFLEGSPDFQGYIADMIWSQAYAYANRETMLDAALDTFSKFVHRGREVERINCHHNYATRELHMVRGVERELWITRKGAIRAQVGDLGLIPGSMGTRSYVVRGLGNALSWNSCSHGAGRKMSRSDARKLHTAKDLRAQMEGRSWQSDQADKLIDEIPSSYKDIDTVMAAQTDLVEIVHSLRQILNYKGT
jgi:tRNA-splicing ligase RtcB (3'-phosphate/5'-hydroxy nucleic acid ligase)